MQNAYKQKDVKNKFKMLLAKNIRYPVKMQFGGVKMVLLPKKKKKEKKANVSLKNRKLKY